MTKIKLCRKENIDHIRKLVKVEYEKLEKAVGGHLDNETKKYFADRIVELLTGKLKGGKLL